TYVTGFASSAMAEKFSPLRDEAGREPVPVSYELLRIGRGVASPAETELLQPSVDQNVIEILQRLHTDKQVIGLQTSVVPAAHFPGLEQQMRSGQGLYPLFASFGVLVIRIEETIGIVTAHDDAAHLLEVDVGKPLLEVSRRAFGHDGDTVELRTSHYLPAGVRYASSIA
ncbi:MAG: GntR family transcriptional regulator, partial [Hyphomicrobiaceae bacterium]